MENLVWERLPCASTSFQDIIRNDKTLTGWGINPTILHTRQYLSTTSICTVCKRYPLGSLRNCVIHKDSTPTKNTQEETSSTQDKLWLPVTFGFMNVLNQERLVLNNRKLLSKGDSARYIFPSYSTKKDWNSLHPTKLKNASPWDYGLFTNINVCSSPEETLDEWLTSFLNDPNSLLDL